MDNKDFDKLMQQKMGELNEADFAHDGKQWETVAAALGHRDAPKASPPMIYWATGLATAAVLLLLANLWLLWQWRTTQSELVALRTAVSHLKTETTYRHVVHHDTIVHLVYQQTAGAMPVGSSEATPTAVSQNEMPPMVNQYAPTGWLAFAPAVRTVRGVGKLGREGQTNASKLFGNTALEGLSLNRLSAAAGIADSSAVSADSAAATADLALLPLSASALAAGASLDTLLAMRDTAHHNRPTLRDRLVVLATHLEAEHRSIGGSYGAGRGEFFKRHEARWSRYRLYYQPLLRNGFMPQASVAFSQQSVELQDLLHPTQQAELLAYFEGIERDYPLDRLQKVEGGLRFVELQVALGYQWNRTGQVRPYISGGWYARTRVNYRYEYYLERAPTFQQHYEQYYNNNNWSLANVGGMLEGGLQVKFSEHWYLNGSIQLIQNNDVNLKSLRSLEQNANLGLIFSW